jgi:hypothetical protein
MPHTVNDIREDTRRKGRRCPYHQTGNELSSPHRPPPSALAQRSCAGSAMSHPQLNRPKQAK